MKLVTFTIGDRERLGAVTADEGIIDLEKAYALYRRESDVRSDPQPDFLTGDMCGFLRAGDEALATARNVVAHIAAQDRNALRLSATVVDLNQVRLNAPVPRPGTLVSAGKNFSDHVSEMSSKKGPTHPVAFLKIPGTIIGPGDDVPYPSETQKLDYEVELAVIIGRPCVDVTREEALTYVAGYAAFNDISARDVIRGENETGVFLMGKNFPGFAPMGPCLVTADEIPDPQNLKLRLRVNGELRQDSNLSYMIFDIKDMIAYWSQMGLEPGDVLTTGTPRGVAAGRKEGQSPWWLKPGDVVEAEVDGVGTLRNRIVGE